MLKLAHIRGIATQNLRVYKVGDMTRLTEGILTGLSRTIPDSPDDPLDKELPEYYGVVSWVDEETPFAESGDSGSLVYLPIGQKIVPIGIHQGSTGPVSYCLLSNWVLDTLETVIDRGLFFCPSNCPGP